MGRRLQRIRDWIVLTTIFCFVIGLLLLSPVHFVIGLFALAALFGLIVAFINDWRDTLFKSKTRLRISYRKENNNN